MKRLLLFLAVAFLSSSAAAQTPNAWINEFHYDNDGTDTGEFIEVVVEDASQYGVLSDFTVVLYNGANGTSYETIQLSSFTTNGVRWGGAFSIYTYFFPDGASYIQNGPDGIALCYQGALIAGQFLSYEGGGFAADGGCADGQSSTDIGVSETGNTPEGSSLQLETNNGASYSDFSWEGPLQATPGEPNENQSFKPIRGGNTECPVGTELLAKYEWENGGYDFEEGDDVITTSDGGTETDARWDWDWESAGDDDGVAAVVVKGGTSNTTVFSPTTTSGTITDEEIAGAISNVQFCVTPGDCPQSYVVSDHITRQPSGSTPGQVTIEFANDSDVIEQVDFIDEDGNLFLENLVVVEAPDDFEANDSDELSWSHTGSQDPPTNVIFVLEQADINETYFRYFARLTTECGSTFIDPPGVFEMLPDRFALQGVYPNPSTGVTTIQFDLDESSDVQVVVYDVMGRKVATLVDRPMQSGSHRVRWNGESSTGQPVASGIYFYRLEAGSQVRTERISIIR